jgi:hypothetical protein
MDRPEAALSKIISSEAQFFRLRAIAVALSPQSRAAATDRSPGQSPGFEFREA